MNQADLLPDPIQQFEKEFALAKQKTLSDHTAMVLSTCTPEGKPASRVALLKIVSPEGFTFFTNYQSHKSHEIEANPNVSICCYWPEINQQVRIEGQAEKATTAISDEYFASRPRISQLGAWASHQSQPLDSRETLMERLATLEAQYRDKPVPRPPHWGGWLLRPLSMEFWYNGDFRLHDRFLYTRDSTNSTHWTITRLNP